jgi:Tol biopolymer transport system component
MTTERRLAGDLPNILADLAMGPYPDYIDDVLASTSKLPQRPAWTFPERWLPMVDIARQPLLAPGLPWRSISLALLLIAALLAAAAALFIGAQQRLPAPYGPARNGLVAYESAGNIYTADPITGVATAILPGPETDVAPRFSLDGTHVVFERSLGNDTGQLYVGRSDGSQLTLITPEPVVMSAADYEFSPDGRSVLFMSTSNGLAVMSIAQADGSGVRELDVGMPAREGSFRPPDGAEILFVGWGDSGGSGVFAVDTVNGDVRQIVKPSVGRDLTGAAWSPDGSRILYWVWNNIADGMTARTHVISADGTGDIKLPGPRAASWNAVAAWSNDGSRIFLIRGYTGGGDDVRPVVLPADGTSVGVEIAFTGTAERTCCSAWIWSPDDSKIIGRPGGTSDPVRQMILDPVAGTSLPAPWTSPSDPTWQRQAP